MSPSEPDLERAALLERLERYGSTTNGHAGAGPDEPTVADLTEDALALEFTRRHREELRYVHEAGWWLRFEPGAADPGPGPGGRLAPMSGDVGGDVSGLPPSDLVVDLARQGAEVLSRRRGAADHAPLGAPNRAGHRDETPGPWCSTGSTREALRGPA